MKTSRFSFNGNSLKHPNHSQRTTNITNVIVRRFVDNNCTILALNGRCELTSVLGHNIALPDKRNDNCNDQQECENASYDAADQCAIVRRA